MTSSCTISFLASRFDAAYIEHTIPHVVRTCNYPFAERLLNLDTAPLPPHFRGRPNVPDLEALRQCGRRLITEKVIDRIIEFDDTFGTGTALRKRHFGGRLRDTRDCRGIPLWGWISGLEACRTRYFLHFDCDVLIYQHPEHSWIDEAIRLLARRGDVMCVAPLPGPPAQNGRPHQRNGVAYERDPEGFFRFKTFTSRKFLIDVERFEELLPLRPAYVSLRRRLSQLITGKSGRCNWETMVSRRLQQSRFIRADLDSPDAWTVHCRNHDAAFLEGVPQIIPKIERGWYPRGQAGHYNLQLPQWT